MNIVISSWAINVEVDGACAGKITPPARITSVPSSDQARGEVML